MLIDKEVFFFFSCIMTPCPPLILNDCDAQEQGDRKEGVANLVGKLHRYGDLVQMMWAEGQKAKASQDTVARWSQSFPVTLQCLPTPSQPPEGKSLLSFSSAQL